jgi:polyisoprenoid-binding protein YceI
MRTASYRMCHRFVASAGLGDTMKKRAAFVTISTLLLAFTAIAQGAQQGGGAGAPPGAAGVSYDPASVPAGTYVVDLEHAAVTGKLRHAGLSHFVFRFNRFDARFTYDPAKPDAPNIRVSIDPTSIDTGVPGFDTNLATSDRHFNVPKYAAITFESNSLRRTGPDKGVMSGNITFLGKTRPMDFDVTFLGVNRGRGGLARVAFSATTSLKRSDFGFAEGSDNLADEVTVAVEADFVQEAPAP